MNRGKFFFPLFMKSVLTFFRVLYYQISILNAHSEFCIIKFQFLTLIQSFVSSNFNRCPLLWMLSSVKSLNKIENLQKRALRFMLSDYESSHDELLRLSGSCAINVRLKRDLYIEIYKTLNDFKKFAENERNFHLEEDCGNKKTFLKKDAADQTIISSFPFCIFTTFCFLLP